MGGGEKNNLPVIAPNNVQQLEFELILVASQYYYQIYQQLLQLGVSHKKIKILSERVLSGKFDDDKVIDNSAFRGQEILSEGTGFSLVTLPKSGTMFTWQNLVNISNKGFPRWLYEEEKVKEYQKGIDNLIKGNVTTGDFSSQKIVDIIQLKNDLEKGAIVGFHMPANFHNIKKLEQAGVKKLTVLLRDPKDALVSWTHHLNNELAARMIEVQKFYFLPDYYTKLSINEQLNFQVKSYYALCVNWIESWLFYAADQNHELDIQIVYFDEMKNNPLSYFERICKFHDNVTFDLSLLNVASQGSLHYRRGKNGSWKDEIPQESHDLLDAINSERMETAYQNLVEKNKYVVLLLENSVEIKEYKRGICELLNTYTFCKTVKNLFLNFIKEYYSDLDYKKIYEEVSELSMFDFRPDLSVYINDISC
ncbi:hypothetical protein A9Q74_14070 [Colwellia sp. 39_35_sub15_T18]|nr:hypothetical protein A9Q74_14070 [Colwellia sp. 39_35_sub15_T18]